MPRKFHDGRCGLLSLLAAAGPFYISGENLFTITKYSGTDPEFSRSSPLDTGIDSYIFPFTRSFTVGAQLTF